MKRTILLLVCLSLPSCGYLSRRPAMVRTTVTRPVVTEGVSSRGMSLTTSGVETVTTEAPYETPFSRSAAQAGANLFAR